MDINDIAKQADKLSPSQYKKSEIYILMREAIAEYDSYTSDDFAHLFACMYQYFQPAKPKNPKTPEQWVSLAMGKKDILYYLNYIYSDGKRIAATDGHRLHVFETDKYAAGYYDKNMNLVHNADYAQYPDIDTVMSDMQKFKTVDFDTLEVSTAGKDTVYRFDGVSINAMYLKHACIGMDASIQYTDKTSAVQLHDGDKHAVVIPMRLD